MRVDKKFAPLTISIDSKEDLQFFTDMILFAQEHLYSQNRWSSSVVRKVDQEMNEKLNFFKRLLA